MSDSPKSWSTEMLKKTQDWLKNNDDIPDEQKALYKALCVMLNSLYQVHNSHFGNYPYIFMRLPLGLLLKFLEKHKDKSKTITSDEYNVLFGFVNSIFTTVSSTSNATHHFFQNPGFDIGIYNIPVMLSAFYVAFIDEVKTFLVDLEIGMLPEHPNNEYEFLLSTELFTKTSVKALFRDSPEYTENYTDRLLLIKVPERELYNDNFAISITHEIAHFVGNAVRLREKRHDLIKTFVISVIRASIIKSFNHVEDIDVDVEKLTTEMQKILTQNVAMVDIDLILMKNFYTDGIREVLQLNFDTCILENFDDLVEPLKSEVWRRLKKLSDKNDEKIMQLYEKLGFGKSCSKSDMLDGIIRKICEELEQVKSTLLGWGYTSKNGVYFNYDNIPFVGHCIEECIYLCKETYADLITMLTLKPSLSKYIRTFQKLINGYPDSKRMALYDTRVKTIFRILVIENVANYKDEWDKLCAEIDDKHTIDIKKHNDIIRAIRHLQECNPFVATEEEDIGETSKWYLTGSLIDATLYGYMVACYKQYTDGIKETSNKLLRNNLSTLYYNICSSHDIASNVTYMQPLIQKYKEKIEARDKKFSEAEFSSKEI